MSNGTPPESAAPYIIICSIRTEIQAAKDTPAKVVAVSRGAAQLCSFMQTAYGATAADFLEISNLQHFLMDNPKLKKSESDAKIAEMIGLFYQLEDKFK